MVKIYYLGTCSGTEPMPNMHHTSSILEVDGKIYWFDMGEGCAHSAYTSGIDVVNCRAIFVSHPHIDHIGGMANVIFLFNKLNAVHKIPLANNNTLEVFFPDTELLGAIKSVALSGRHGRGKMCFTMNEHQISDGVLFDDGTVKVTAKSNRHLRDDGEGGVYHAFSFLVEADGKRIIFSGDVKSPTELDELISGGVDLLIMETGHHKVSDVCEYAISRGVKKLRFNHHGREILGGRADAEALVADYSAKSGIPMMITFDGFAEEY